ncbi:MFS transporter [Bombilactobacillus bombi]|uniref:MFS transporter n=1 Tax=Bombilactobacillus bombi TaxID=1303590 RepID=UPI0015E5C537|nr:MFS transporter [Bombilactobacillus bombi]MBA1435192.1 MFS transporter [Bombilactobacillus bombi]
MDKKRRKILSTIAMCLGIFLVMLDTTIMNIALPAIQQGLKVNTSQLSWTLNVYTIIFASFTIPLSRLGEIFGRNRMYLFGLIGFGIGSLIAGMANSFTFLILGRAVSSIGAAILLPLANTIGISTWNVDQRFKVVAALGLTQGGAAAIGPTLGGLITDTLSWHWIFLINIPIVILAVALSLISLSINSETNVHVKIDWWGSIFSMLALFFLTLGIIEGRNWQWTNIKTFGCFISSFIFIIVFLEIEKHVVSPMVNLRLFRVGAFVSSSVVGLLAQFFYIGVIVMMPTFFTRIQGKTEFNAALILLPMSIAVFCFGGLGSLLINKLGPRMIVFYGLVCLALSYYLLTVLNADKVINMSLATLICGIGFGIISGPVNVLAASDLEGDLLTASQSVITVFRQIGSVLGVSIFMSMLNNNLQNIKFKTPQNLSIAYLKMYKFWIPFLVLSLLLSLCFSKKQQYLNKLSK